MSNLNAPLTGRRIVVTRSATQSASLCAAFTALGATAISFPVITFEPLACLELRSQVAQLHASDWLVFTSVNAVNFFAARINVDKLPSVRIAAIGSATCHQLEQLGLTIDLVPTQFTGVQLAKELGDLHGKVVLLPRAAAGRPEITRLLRENGATVLDTPLYDTVQAVPSAESRAALAKGYDMVTFTSPSSVRNFFDLVSPVPSVYFAAIGPSTTEELEKFGRKPTLQANPYTIDALVQSIADYYATPEAHPRL